MDYSFEPIDINVRNLLFYIIQKYGIHTYNYLLIQAKRDKLNIKKLNPPGAFKKKRGKRELGEKFDSKFYPNNYKKDVYYMNYDDLLDNLYMEKKGIDIQFRSSKNTNNTNKKKENEIDPNIYNNYNNINDENNFINSNNLNKNNIINNDKNEEEIIMNNKNNQFTFKQNFNNNFDINNQNGNKNILRGRPKKLNADQLKLNNNEIPQNFNNNYEYENILNNYEYNNNIPIEQNESVNNYQNKENNEEQNESINNNENNNINMNESEDPRLNYVMQKLGLESLIHIFENYHMSFNDVLFLTKEDLNELGFKIFQKNRLLSFIEEYTAKAKNYTLEEIKEFFEENNIYNISGIKE